MPASDYATGGNIKRPTPISSVAQPTPPRDSTYNTHPLPITANPKYQYGADAMRALIRDHFAPGIRLLGFKGTGNNYAFDDPDYHININFQMTSMWPGSAFYVNIIVQDKAKWHREHGDKPYPKNYGDKFSGRIACVDNRLPDHWSIFADTDIEEVAKILLAVLEKRLLPRLFKKLEVLRANPTRWISHL